MTEAHLPEEDVLWSISLSKIILLLNQKNLTQNPNAMNLQDIEAIKAMSSAAQ